MAQDDPSAARDQVARIRASVEKFGGFPEMGRVGQIESTREFAPPGTLFIVVYRVEAERIVIVRVLQAARSIPSPDGFQEWLVGSSASGANLPEASGRQVETARPGPPLR
ncbi:type II toxin-antitoxin system RelE/ParE family toxin [Bosea sp. NBC_00550]|uniref:type II toxin-antitoxin system RelE/ParE family toxin n=1 Tax=Bosea sp. NBC_00550 TaxID=2969621 RepID=UPI003FA424B4